MNPWLLKNLAIQVQFHLRSIGNSTFARPRIREFASGTSKGFKWDTSQAVSLQTLRCTIELSYGPFQQSISPTQCK